MSKNEIVMPDEMTLQDLKDMWEMAETEYAPYRKLMRILDAADRGQMWKAIAKSAPIYQVFTETNHVRKIKTGLCNSIYSVGKQAELLPRSTEDVDHALVFNKVMGRIWYQTEAFKFQRAAGERAAILNVGVTQVGWKNSIVGGTTCKAHKGDVVFQNIDPLRFMKDPYASNDDNCSFMIKWDDYHINKIKNTPIYKERIAELKKIYGENLERETVSLTNEALEKEKQNRSKEKKYHRVIVYWVRDSEDKVWEVHTLNNDFLLYSKKQTAINKFPFALLYCEEPGDSVVGTSPAAAVLRNSIAYNMVLSIMATHAYRAQRPPRYLSMNSGINVREFAKYGADSDKTWLVNGDAREAVHYGKFPDLPDGILELAGGLRGDIETVSQVDDKYLGKDFGSVTTTGGSDNVVNSSTSSDTTKIQLYEDYTRRLTELVVAFYIKYGDERQYGVEDTMTGEVDDVKVDFKKMAASLMFDYEVNIQSELPKNKMRLAQAANILLEKQAQYKPKPELITNEEWLLMQDIPFKDLIFSRLRIERNASTTEDVTQILFQFAGLIEEGIDPNQALEMVIQSMEDQKNPQGQAEGQGPVGNARGAASFEEQGEAPIQDRQAGGEPMMMEEDNI